MEITPTFVLSLGLALITLIGYLVQLKPRMDRLESENKELWAEFQKHKENASIHFDEKTWKQVEKNFNLQINVIEKKLDKLDVKFDSLLGKK
jgi:Tfp pilus assembly protein PilO